MADEHRTGTGRVAAGRPRARSVLDVLCPALGVALLALQVAMIAYARFDEGRYWSWAPHDVMWGFELDVEVGGVRLSHDEARRRYRIRRALFHEHAIEHVKRAVRQYERTYGRGEGARVRLRYDRNGRDPQVWRWPEP